MVHATEVITVLARNYGELIRCVSRVWVNLSRQIVISLGGAPIALFVLIDEFGLAVAGEIAELDECLVAREEDLRLPIRRNGSARRRFGGCITVKLGVAGGEREPTVILPFLGNLAQLGNAMELGIKIQNVLAVEALAGLDELEIGFLKLSDLHDMVLGALELPTC